MKNSPWLWVPSLYFAQGFPYVIVNGVSVVLFKNLGIPNTEIAFYTSWLYLPWVVKPLWSPLVEVKSNKRNWFLVMQFLGCASFILVGFSLNFSSFFIWSLVIFWLAAFWSATHDIAADGYYMIALSEKQQSFFIGIRSTYYRLSVIFGQGGIVILAGLLFDKWGSYPRAWSVAMYVAGGTMLLFFLVNFALSPKTKEQPIQKKSAGFKEIFISYFKKKGIRTGLLFVLTYRLGESQLVKIASPFLLDDSASGGLMLNTTQVGTIYGTFGWISLSVGGILGGLLISKHGLGKWIWPMAIALNLPNLFYIFLSIIPNIALEWTALTIIVEQFGYGFGFAAYLLYMIYLAEGPSKTAHYALTTGFMALGMMLPGLVSGYIQEWLGYTGFFIWVLIAGVPGMLAIRCLDFPETFGLKSST